jgi:hypothetical protein
MAAVAEKILRECQPGITVISVGVIQSAILTLFSLSSLPSFIYHCGKHGDRTLRVVFEHTYMKYPTRR